MKHYSTRLLCLLLPAALLSTVSNAQTTAINFTGAVAAPSAILDVSATTRGLLIPRMDEAQRLAIPMIAANNGLWVYQIIAVGNTTPDGLWYYDATAPNAGWYNMASGAAWAYLGNSLTNPATNYLGTSDAQPLVIATNATERMRLGTNGFLGIANNNPPEALSITGAVHMTAAAPGSLTDQAGVIRYNTAPTLPAPFPALNPVIPYHQGNTTGAATGWDRLENAFTEYYNQNYPGSVLNCGNGTAETPNNGGTSNDPTPTYGDTPFPTFNGRGSKRQYLFTAAELAAAPIGLCPGNITELALRVIGADPNSASPPFITVYVRMRNSVGLTDLSGGFDQATSATASLNGVLGQNFLVSSGLMLLPLTTPFNWTGGDLVVDLSYVRAATVGTSPAVQVNTGFANCAFYGQIATAVNGQVLHAAIPPVAPPGGWTSLNFPANPQPNCQLGATNERAVIRFTGQAQVPTPTVVQGDYLQYGGGLMIGSAAWATGAGIFQGPGVIRAEFGVYDKNVQLSDHVFDRYFDGAPRKEEAHLGQPLMPLDELGPYLASERHLPSMPSRTEWETNGKSSLGELSTGLWETVEQQALYITELNTDLKGLEASAFGERMESGALTARIAAIQDSPRLTASEKQQLIAALRVHNAHAE